MRANAIPLLAIFETKLRLEVPLFQRQYVWGLEKHWQPLWEDLVRKFTEHLSGRKDAPIHFLGAMVLDQKLTPITYVERRQIIDGQQRLTTLQIILAAFRDFCRASGCEDLANECEAYILNRGMMADPKVDKFKVWPTQLDQPQFEDVITAGSRAALESKHPLVRPKYARRPLPRPRMVEAYLYFYGQIRDFFLGATEAESPVASDQLLGLRLEECFACLKSALCVVGIDLELDDDAQVIFETLNARGEPLLPADLLRNFIFLRAARQGEPQESLYSEYWRPFDDVFWRQEVRQGRLIRPRSDLFLQHFLASRETVDIPISHLFVEYKYWIEKQKPFTTVREELATLARQAADFRRIVSPRDGDVVAPIARFLEQFDIGTAYPLLLYLLDAAVGEDEWSVISEVLESYLLRRALCSMSTKNYNRIFLTLTRTLKRDGVSVSTLRNYLSELTGESSEWPRDTAFATYWQNQHAYSALQNPKIVHVLRRINDTYAGNKSEQIVISSALTVEHILPQNWLENWPLPDGSHGLTTQELWVAKPDDPRAEATRRRNALIQTFGNLTILTQPLNSALSNSEWSTKKPELMRSSLLPINLQLCTAATWDEEAIQSRSKELFDRATKIWPRPE